MPYQSILKDLEKKQYAPVYFLHGEEDYFIDLVSDYIEDHTLEESEKAFNQVALYGKETDARQVIDQAMQFPMMATHRVVLLKEAQAMKGFENLLEYLRKPSPHTILVISYKHKKFDKRKKSVWEALKKNAVILEAKKIYDSQLPSYLIRMAEEEGLSLDGKIAAIISQHLGNDLSKAANEISKLKLNLKKGGTVTLDDVQKYIGISKDYNVFELQKAIGKRDKTRAYAIARYFAQNHKAHPIQMNVASLYNYFSTLMLARKYLKSDDKSFARRARINPYFAREYKEAAVNYSYEQIRTAIELLHEMDKHSKGIEARRSDPLGSYQEFLFRLFAA